MAGRNPLFPRAMDALRKAALAEMRSTALGQTINAMRRASSRGSHRDMQRLTNDLRKLARGTSLEQQLRSSDAFKLVDNVQRYAKGGLRQTVMKSLFKALGPVGSVLESLLRPGGNAITDLKKELETAANVLEMFGYGVTRPGQKSSAPPPASAAVSTAGINIPQAVRELEEMGFTVTPPPASHSVPHPSQRNKPEAAPSARVPEPQAPATDQDVVTVRVGGQKFRISRNDPLLTGEMIPVKSSNVHSIGFTWNNRNPISGTLKVRFLDNQNGRRVGPGPLYFYYDVHPQMFIAFQKASSKGKWVWDNLRIRGTVSGHQKRYALAGLSNSGYVPRNAVRLGQEEWYLPRTVRGRNGQEYRSRLKAQMVRRLNDGKPNRGGPNRGTPNRGR